MKHTKFFERWSARGASCRRLRFLSGVIVVGAIAACSSSPDSELFGAANDDGGSGANSVWAGEGACVVNGSKIAPAGSWCGTNLLTATSSAIYLCDGVNENAVGSIPCSECKTGLSPGQDRCLSATGSDGSTAGDANVGSGGVAGNATDGGAAGAPDGDGAASSAGEAGSGGSSGCAGLYEGWYCGGDKVNGDLNTLYHCKDGQSDQQIVCPYVSSCKIMPEGTNDYCPCVKLGYYCGGNEIKGDSDTLYYCNGERVDTGLTVDCAGLGKDCSVEAPGTPDQCK